MMSTPASIIARARASACSGAMNSPPSENESGVTLSTPMTAGIGRSSSVRSTSSPTEPAAGTDGEGEAFMRPALAVGEGGFKAGLGGDPVAQCTTGPGRARCSCPRSVITSVAKQSRLPLRRDSGLLRCARNDDREGAVLYLPSLVPGSIRNLRRQLFRLGDDVADRLFRGQDAEELFLLVGIPHALGQPCRISVGELAHGGDAGGADQADLGPAHAGDAHVVGDVGPFQQQLLADAGLGGERLAALHGRSRLEQRVGRADSLRLQLVGGKGRQALNLGDRICHDTQYEKRRSGELAEARSAGDDLAHLIRSDFVSAVAEKFTGDVL